jgi:16S rRNA (cytidine1402-2'-O)-methyltransferase
MPGKLYLVATPIGNLEDITLRAIRILQEADLIAAEDTRNSGRLLKHLSISKPLISYFEHNKKLRENLLLDQLADGKNIALICDAGTPGLSDPGADIVKAAIERGIEVIAIPGASALLTALTASGLNQGSFCFEGFLPREKSARKKALQSLTDEQRVMVFYEAPHRVLATLDDMRECFGAKRQIAVCRELTKIFEEIRRGSIDSMISHFSAEKPRGEFTLVLSGAETRSMPVDWGQIESELMSLLAEGISRKEAAKELAVKYRQKSRDIYHLGLNKK